MQFNCDKCDKKFTREIDLSRHNNRKIPCDRVLVCDKCGKEFNQLSHLTKHINKKISCCDKKEELLIILAIEKEKTKQARLNHGKCVNVQNIFGDQINYINNIDEIDFVKPVSLWEAENLIETDNVDKTLSLLIKFQFNNENYPKNKCIKKHNGATYSKLNDAVVDYKKYKNALINVIQKSCKQLDYDYGPIPEAEIYKYGVSQRMDHIHDNDIDTIKKVGKFVGNHRNDKNVEHNVGQNV